MDKEPACASDVVLFGGKSPHADLIGTDHLLRYAAAQIVGLVYEHSAACRPFKRCDLAHSGGFDRRAQLHFQQAVDIPKGDLNMQEIKRPILVGDDFVLVGFKEAEWKKVK